MSTSTIEHNKPLGGDNGQSITSVAEFAALVEAAYRHNPTRAELEGINKTAPIRFNLQADKNLMAELSEQAQNDSVALLTFRRALGMYARLAYINNFRNRQAQDQVNALTACRDALKTMCDDGSYNVSTLQQAIRKYTSPSEWIMDKIAGAPVFNSPQAFQEIKPEDHEELIELLFPVLDGEATQLSSLKQEIQTTASKVLEHMHQQLEAATPRKDACEEPFWSDKTLTPGWEQRRDEIRAEKEAEEQDPEKQLRRDKKKLKKAKAAGGITKDDRREFKVLLAEQEEVGDVLGQKIQAIIDARSGSASRYNQPDRSAELRHRAQFEGGGVDQNTDGPSR